MGEYTVGRIEQLTLAHKSARPKHDNPPWMNTHCDLGIALEEIERLTKALETIIRNFCCSPNCESIGIAQSGLGWTLDQVNAFLKNSDQADQK